MLTISSFLQADRVHCDHLLARAEALAQGFLWVRARCIMARFDAAFQTHLRMEEHVLFAALEQYCGDVLKPTALMRREHQQLKKLSGSAARAVKKGNVRRFLGAAKLLRQAMDAHCMKEETVLYRMADAVLRPAARFLVGEMDAMKAPARTAPLHG